MKEVLIILLVLLFTTVSFAANDFTLDHPKVIKKPAIGWVLYGYDVRPDKYTIYLNWYDVDNKIVKQGTIDAIDWTEIVSDTETINHNWFSKINNAVIKETHIGKKRQRLLFRKIRNVLINNILKDAGTEAVEVVQ